MQRSWVRSKRGPVRDMDTSSLGHRYVTHIGRVEEIRRGDVTKQYGEDQADDSVWRAQL